VTWTFTTTLGSVSRYTLRLSSDGSKCVTDVFNSYIYTAVRNPSIDIGTFFQSAVQLQTFTATGTYSNTTSGTYTILTFTGSGSLIINNFSKSIYYLVVAGGGAGGIDQGGGGGAGGVLQGSVSLSGNDTITITVGNGGIGSSNIDSIQSAGSGQNSSIIFSTNTANNKTSIGGGYGAEPPAYGGTYMIPGNGGSSGGVGCAYSGSSFTNSSTAVSGQGNKGGNALNITGGAGGGGAGAVGGDGNVYGGAGGNGVQCNQNGISLIYPTTYWGGGGGGGTISSAIVTNGGNGGLGGGGGGGSGTGTQGTGGSGLNSGNPGTTNVGGNGGTNTGGGGGGRSQWGTGGGGSGGSGIVILAFLT